MCFRLLWLITYGGERIVGYQQDKIDKIDVGALVMAEKTLEEQIMKKRWYNPLPQVKYTERPDVVAAHLMEGHIAILVDTSPSAMILPATLFHFTQHAEDYYQNITVGTHILFRKPIPEIRENKKKVKNSRI
ncbi:MAG: spore germination protein [Clostridiaceae bacterium]|jgi:stage V sporulation protein AF|nr:spore germination protein [Clostridiaceae bacterium]